MTTFVIYGKNKEDYLKTVKSLSDCEGNYEGYSVIYLNTEDKTELTNVFGYVNTTYLIFLHAGDIIKHYLPESYSDLVVYEPASALTDLKYIRFGIDLINKLRDNCGCPESYILEYINNNKYQTSNLLSIGV